MKKETEKKVAAEKNMDEMFYIEPSEEELQQEIQEIKEKRIAYQKEMQQEVLSIRKEEAARKRRRTASIVKAAVIVLVAGSCLFAFSMRSEANRMWWLKKVEKIVGTDSKHVVNNDADRAVSELPEQQAIAEIEEKAGVPMPDLYYKPTGMIFDSYDCDEIIRRGRLYYLYEEHVILIDGYTADKDTAYAWSYDGQVLSEELVETEYSSVMIREIKAEGDTESTFVAEWTYHNHQYQIEGKVPLEELKLIIENIFY